MTPTEHEYQPQELIITRTGPLRINMTIAPQKDEHNSRYFVHINGLFHDNTDITLHASDSKNGQILGSCRFNKFHTTRMHLTLGDQQSYLMFSPQFGCYSWCLMVIRHTEGKVPQRREFLWKRTEASRVSGRLGLELCGPDTSDIYAEYFGAASGSLKAGKLRVRFDLGDTWKTMVLLTLSALIEKERQRRARQGHTSIAMLGP
ncbi:hypothetical protein BDV33DRAFT_231536 [Aspergillus novoparasiticus]|uniref:Tubby C-terminal-like domain-containing protein n=1 Tax=Aspergillus novoparasiticus TaxID=986946 RepID=A0A5N6EPH2_9EURO|nr:hypothetical protein BDV33DRAFT_231536 [Aspergillus novoparasiticus]